jgi:hypothetical protein
VTVVRVKPVSVWVTVTVTPGRTPPLSSVTLPLNCAVAWAEAVDAATNTISTTVETIAHVRFIELLPGRM